MTEPGSGDDLAVALQALRTDARVWTDAAARMDAPRRTLDATTLTPADLSMWAVDRGLDGIYEEVRRQVAAVIDQGRTAFVSIGDTLRAAADTYETEDNEGARRLGGG